MKQYVIDQLREEDYYQIRDYLDENAQKTVLQEIYRVNIPPELYSDIQMDHSDCQPYYFAINLSRRQVAFEWLIRSVHTLRCSCIGYATPEQREHIIEFADNILEVLKIKL